MKQLILLAFLISAGMATRAQNVGIGTTTPATSLEVSSHRKSGTIAYTDSLMGGANIGSYEFIDLPAGVKGEYRGTGNNDGSGVLGVATAPNQLYGNGVTGYGNWIGVLGLGKPGGNAAIVAEANGATNALRVEGKSIFSNDAALGGNIDVLYNASVGGTLKVSGGSPAAGKILTATSTTGDAVWQAPAAFRTGFGVTTVPTSTQTIATGANATVNFASGQSFGWFDDGSNFNNTTHGYVVPATGFYQFQVAVNLYTATAATSSSIEIQPTVNGLSAGPYYSVYATSGRTIPTSLGTAFTIKLTTGDVVAVRLTNNTGVPVVVYGPSCWFSGYRIY